MSTEIPKKEVTLEAIKSIVDQSIAHLATKEEMHTLVAKLATKEEMHVLVAKLATKDEFSALREDVGDIRMKLDSHIVETKNRFDGLTLSMDDLPTRAEMNTEFDNLQSQIDDLAISVNNYGTYPTRQEFGLHDKRLSLLEEAVFV